jgi:2-keto-4-pentenoate hydratase/2-oxohepta-3-ene-1,7-dioic acid hydratase in catechol pathway
VRLVTFTHSETADLRRVGILDSSLVVDPFAVLAASYGGDRNAVLRAAAEAPRDMVALFASGATQSGVLVRALELVQRSQERGRILRGPDGEAAVVDSDSVQLLAPVPRPPRLRDYFTSAGHLTAMGRPVPEAFNEMPLCYKCNVNSVVGPGAEVVWPAYTDQLDYELEVGFYVGAHGRNLSVGEAESAIAGVTLFNDISARDIQKREVEISLGPAKGKDFSNPMGPCVVTMDEIDEWQIELSAKVNGETWSTGTTADRQYSFAEVLAWASYCEDVEPGEFLAIGTVPGGCGKELGRWIEPGDVVELCSPQIGTLANPIGSPEAVPLNAGIPAWSRRRR